jgi:hypothetical protein
MAPCRVEQAHGIMPKGHNDIMPKGAQHVTPLCTLKGLLPCPTALYRDPGSAGTVPDRPALARQILDGPKRLKVLTDGAFFGEQVCRAHESAARSRLSRKSSAMHCDDGRQRPNSKTTQRSNRQRTPQTDKRQNDSSAALRFVHSLSGP